MIRACIFVGYVKWLRSLKHHKYAVQHVNSRRSATPWAPQATSTPGLNEFRRAKIRHCILPFQKLSKNQGARNQKNKTIQPANIKIWAQPPLPNTKHPSRSMEMEVICFTTWAKTLGIWSNNSHIFIHKGWKVYTFLFIMCIRDTGARIYSIIYIYILIYTYTCIYTANSGGKL